MGDKMSELMLSDKDKEKYGSMKLFQSACMVPSTHEFSALKSETQNLKYKGNLILTPKYLIFRGNEIVSCGKINDITGQQEPEEVPIELKSSVFTLDIELNKVKDVFVGHDELFGRRHLIFPKLRIATSTKIWYFVLFDKSLKSKKADVEERSNNMKAKIGAAKRGELSDGESPAPKVVRPTIIKDVPIPMVIENKSQQTQPTGVKAENLQKLVKKPTVLKPEVKAPEKIEEPIIEEEKPQLKNIEKLKQQGPETKIPSTPIKPVDKLKVEEKSLAQIVQGQQDEIASKKTFQITKVKPYEPQAATPYSPMAQVMKPTKIEDKDDKYLDDLLVDMSEEVDLDILEGELSQASADTSINRCPHCGWMLAWNSVTCPKCRKRTDNT